MVFPSLQDAAKRADVKLQEAHATAEQRSTELTRARAEVLQLRQELAESTQQLLLVGRAQTAAADRSTGTPGKAGNSDGGNVQDALAAKLATAQVLKREAEDRAAELSRKLANAQARLVELQQQTDDNENIMDCQLYQAQAQLVRAKADLATSKAAAAAAAATRSNDGSFQQASASQQQQQQDRSVDGRAAAPFAADRQRSVASQLEAADQLVRSMRATAAAALTDSAGTAAAAAAAAPTASMLSTGATPAPQQQQQHEGPPSRYQSPVNDECTSPFKAWSGAAGSLDQHIQQYQQQFQQLQQYQQQQQQQLEVGRAGVVGSSNDSKPSSPRGGWLYQKLFATKEQSRGGSLAGSSPAAAAAATAAIAAGTAAAAAAHSLKAGQAGSDAWGQPQSRGGGSAAGGAAGAEAPCLY
jgi:hypothetical protein